MSVGTSTSPASLEHGAVLVVNAGSSSVKFCLYALTETHAVGHALAEGLVERIGALDARFHYERAGVPRDTETLDIASHESALHTILRTLLGRERGVLSARTDVKIVGHRVVHGGNLFHEPSLVTREVKEQIEACVRFAPLHNPVNLAGLDACERLFPTAAQVAVFDTSFHATLAPHVFLYPLPHILYERHSIRRYGFHGTSHKYVAQRLEAAGARDGFPTQKIVVCHLGNGASVCAIRDGKSVDTSMGFTPLEGLMMGTRCGDVDAGVLLSLLGLEGMTVEELERIANKYSGFRGVTEDTSDVRTVLEKAENGYERHRLALDMFCYRVKKYIGAYAAVLGGIDALVFTGGVGENAAAVRADVCKDLDFLGVELDAPLNAARGRDERRISSVNARVQVYVIPTNEEWMIAAEAAKVTESKVTESAKAGGSLP